MGAFHECLSGIIECIKCPSENELGVRLHQQYKVWDGHIKGVKQPWDFLDISDMNWYYKKYNIKFKIVEKWSI